MAQRKRKSVSPDASPDIKDLQQLAVALGRVRDPMMRYMLALFVDLASERIAQLEAGAGTRTVEAGVANTTQH